MIETDMFSSFRNSRLTPLLIAALVLGISAFYLSTPAFAASTCDGTDTAILSCSDDENGVWAMLLLTMNIMAAGVGILAVGGIVYGSILWTTAEDKQDQITKAKTVITNVVIGLIAFALMWATLQFIVPGGVFNRTFGFSKVKNATNKLPGIDDSSNNTHDQNDNNAKALIRIGAYNAKSVDESAASQLIRFKLGWAKINDAADIIVMAEFSTIQHSYIQSNFSHWTAYYPANSRGDRGKAILYRNDKYTASNGSSVALPLISTSGQNTTTYEPTLTLTRKKDDAKISIMAVHLAAINGNIPRWETNQKNQQPIIGKWLKGGGNSKRVAVGDFNWYKGSHSENLTGIDMKNKGEGYIRFMIPKAQDFGSFFKVIDTAGISDHDQVVTEVETNGNGKNADSNGPSSSDTPAPSDIKVRNFRDASSSSGGDVLKKATLYRSASLAGITDKSADNLAELLGSHATIIDLRTARQVAEASDHPIKGVSDINIPIEGITDTTPMVTDSGQRSQLAKALKFAANTNGPVLIHCAAGKDRTGWTVAMIMYVSGANNAQVMKEYLKSNEDIPGGVKAEWLNNGLQALHRNYDTVPKYLKAAGLSDADLAKLKNKFGA